MAIAAMPDDDEALERELRRYYLDSAGERQAGLIGAVRAAAVSPGETAVLEGLRDVIHKQAGSAGMYGFPGLSKAAKALELRIIAAAQAPPATPALIADVQAFCDQVVRENETARAADAAAESRSSGAAAGPPASARVEPIMLPPPRPRSPAPQAARQPPAEGILSETRRRLVVAVLAEAGFEVSVLAREVGRELARADTHLLVARVAGASAEAARGYREQGGGGLVLAAISGSERKAAAHWVDLPLPSGPGAAATGLLPLWADAAIAIGGGPATLSAMAGFLEAGKPVAVLSSSGGAAAVVLDLEGCATIPAKDAGEAVLGLLLALAESAADR